MLFFEPFQTYIFVFILQDKKEKSLKTKIRSSLHNTCHEYILLSVWCKMTDRTLACTRDSFFHIDTPDNGPTTAKIFLQSEIQGTRSNADTDSVFWDVTLFENTDNYLPVHMVYHPYTA